MSSESKLVAILVAGLLLGAGVTGALIWVVTSLVGGDTRQGPDGPPVFEEVTATASVDQTYDGEFEYFVGGGVAVFDCNDDRMPDLYVAGGENPARLFVNESTVGGNIVFSEADTGPTGATGAYPLDVDSDGITDLAVLRRGENVMMRGLGDCSFERANDTWGIDGGDEWTVAFSAFWGQGDRFPTLAFGNYLRLKESGDRDECEDHFLFRPGGDDRYGAPVRLTPGYCTLSALFSDWGRSGSPDLRLTNDRHYYTDGEEQMWEVADAPATYGEDEGWRHLEIWGMGIASQDLDDDGLPEVFLTSQGDNKLQTLADGPARPTYEDIALRSGVTAHHPFTGDTLRPSTAWHAEFDDVNNDTFTDLFVTKGNVEAQPDFAAEDPNNLLLGQADGTFVEVAEEADIVDFDRSRGASVVDLNLDGQLDIVVVERREPVRVWKNTGTRGNWLLLDISQEGPNLDAIGAWVEVEAGDRRISKEITVGGGHASGELGWLHFGLGSSTSARVKVTWPDGTASEWEDVDANRAVTWERDSAPEVWAHPAD